MFLTIRIFKLYKGSMPSGKELSRSGNVLLILVFSSNHVAGMLLSSGFQFLIYKIDTIIEASS